jgi:hypothetical protein
MRIWPWGKRENRDELEHAQREREHAERKEEEVKPLARSLHGLDRKNHFAARFRAAGFGGE